VQFRDLFLAIFKDGFDGAVTRGVEEQSPGTGCLEPLVAIALRQTDHPLGGAEMIKDPVRKELVDELQTG